MIKGSKIIDKGKAFSFVRCIDVFTFLYRKLLAINHLFYFYTPTFLTCLGMLLSFFYTSFLISSYLGAVAIVI